MAAARLNKVIEHLRSILIKKDAGRITDAELWKRYVQHRDETAFELLVRRHGPMVFGVCRRVLHNLHDAEDAFQATFLVLIRRASRLRSPAKIGSWLYGVAYRTALHARDAAFRRRAKEAAAIARTELPDDPWSDLRTVLDQELQRLPERYRAVLTLCDLEGRTRKEVAREFGWPEGTVASRLARARVLLAKRLTRYGLSLTAGTLAGMLSQHACASVLTPLLLSTVKIARLVALGQAATAALVSVKAVSLMEGVVGAMWMTKLKTIAVLIVVFGLGLGTAVVAYQGAERVQPKPQPVEGNLEAATALAEATAERMPRNQALGPVEVAGDPLPTRAVARLGTERFRHGHFVTSLAFASKGKWIVSTDWSGIYVWDAATGKQLRRIGGDFGTQLRSSSLSADGQRLATMEHGDGAIQVWNVNSGELIRQFLVVPRFSAAVLSPDGNIVASSANGTLRLWDVAGGKELRSWEADPKEVHRFTFSPDGKALVTGGQDKVIHVWDVSTGKELRSIRGHSDEVGDLVFSPDGKVLASVGVTMQESKLPNGGMARWGISDNRVHVWDFDSGQEIHQLTVPKEIEPGRPGPFPNGICHTTFARDGKTMATSTTLFKDKSVRIWDITTGKQVAELPVWGGTMAFSPDDKILATASTTMIRLWDTRSGQEQELTKGHQGPIQGLAVSPNGQLVASASQDGTVRLWEAATGKESRHFSVSGAAYAVTFSPDGRILASSGNDKTVRLWDIATGQAIRRLQGNQDTWWSPLFSPDGRTLVCSSSEGLLCLWDCATGERLREFKGEWKVFVGRLFFSPDGKILYSWADKKVRVWDTATGKEIREFFAGHADRSYTAAFAPNGKWVACGGQEPTIHAYDLASGEEIQRLGVPGATSCLAFSPDSRTLAWGGWYGEPIVLLEMATNQVRHRFPGHRGRIHALVFWPNGKFLASGSEDTTALIWDLMDNARVLRQESSLSVQALRACWADLASFDGSTAYDALGKLVAAPKQSVPFLKRHLGAVPPESLKAVPKLLADLDNDQFAVRENATQELEQLGDSAEQFLRQALEQRPSAEVRQRLKNLLEKIEKRNGASERLQRLRAVETLETIATPEARKVLQALASGAPEARLTQEAKRALERLAKRP